MSFGFSISDAVLLTQQAWRTVENTRKACGKYDEFSNQASSLHIVLQRLEQEASKPTSLLAQDHTSEEIAILMQGCGRDLKALNSVLEKYIALSDKEWSCRRLRFQVRFGNGETAKMAEIRAKLNHYTTGLSLLLNVVSLGSAGRVEQQMNDAGADLREIKAAVNCFTTELMAGSHESTVLSSYSDDDRSVWKELRRELVADGFKSDIIHKYKPTIKAYVKELAERGLQDDQVGPTTEMTDGYTPDMQYCNSPKGLTLSTGPNSSSDSPVSGRGHGTATERVQKAVSESDLSRESCEDSSGKALTRVNIKHRNTKSNESCDRLSTPSLAVASETRRVSCKRPECSTDSPVPPKEGSETPTESIELGNSPKVAPGSNVKRLLSGQRTTQTRYSSSSRPVRAQTQLQGPDHLENHVDYQWTGRDRSRALVRDSDPGEETELDRDMHVSTVKHTKQALRLHEPDIIEVELRIQGWERPQWIYLNRALWDALPGEYTVSNPGSNLQLLFVGNAAMDYKEMIHILFRLRIYGCSRSAIQRRTEDLKNASIAILQSQTKPTQSARGVEFSCTMVRSILRLYDVTAEKMKISKRLLIKAIRVFSDFSTEEEYLFNRLRVNMTNFACSSFSIRDSNCEGLMIDLVREEVATEDSSERLFAS